MGKKKRVAIDTSLQCKKKCGKRSFVGNDDDRISQLPDEILIDILSFLSINEAARTSVLSSRWRNLWKHTHSLNFDADGVLDNIDEHYELLTSERSKYVKWVNSVLQSHQSLALKEFKIRFALDKSDKNVITRWLEFAFSRQVQRLELDLDNYNDPPEDYCLLDELLILSSSKADKVCIDHPRMLVDFKSVIALSFKFVCVSDGAIEFLLNNCPLLEQLTVCDSEKISKLEVCGPSLRLKHLEFVYCSRLESLKVVSLPRLTTLSVTCLKGVLLKDVPMLVNVSVRCHNDSISIIHLFKVLSCRISELQTLCLGLNNGEFKEEINELCELPKMPKLKKLVIEYDARGDESLIRLAALIRVSPYLEEFVLQFNWYELPRKDRQVKDAVITSPHHHLKVFKFRGYYGGANDFELLSYILENCAALEQIVIDPYIFWLRDKLDVKETARKNAKQKLAPQVPQHIDLVVL